MAGVLWYQGEDDSGSMDLALRYDISFATLVNDYRNLFNDATLPFLYVQLARYDGYGYIYDTIVRNAQLGILSNPVVASHKNLGMTVSIDTDKGTPKAIHPLGKEIVAQRMANQWIAMNEHKAVPSGPLPKEAHLDTNDKSTAIITFQEGTAVKLQAKRPNYTTSATIDNIANATKYSAIRIPSRRWRRINAQCHRNYNWQYTPHPLRRSETCGSNPISMAKQSQLFKHRIQQLELAYEPVHS